MEGTFQLSKTFPRVCYKFYETATQQHASSRVVAGQSRIRVNKIWWEFKFTLVSPANLYVQAAFLCHHGACDCSKFCRNWWESNFQYCLIGNSFCPLYVIPLLSLQVSICSNFHENWWELESTRFGENSRFALVWPAHLYVQTALFDSHALVEFVSPQSFVRIDESQSSSLIWPANFYVLIPLTLWHSLRVWIWAWTLKPL